MLDLDVLLDESGGPDLAIWFALSDSSFLYANCAIFNLLNLLRGIFEILVGFKAGTWCQMLARFVYLGSRILYDFIVPYHDALDLHQIIYLRNHFLMARADFLPFDFVTNFEEICVKTGYQNWYL